MTYEEELEWLFNRFPSYQKVGGRAYKAGIETMTLFDNALGHPHETFPCVHIAGTNGKGSVSHMLAAALAGSGLKVGLYTSPHLVDFRERIKICTKEGYEMVEKAWVFDFLQKWHPFFDKNNPSFFEITTGMAFQYFKEQATDIAIIETGLGGRLDSTNIIQPLISIITNIGLEHCQYLGNTLEEIAGEKAGIIKDDAPAVIGETLLETLPVFQAAASRHKTSLYLAEKFNYNKSFLFKHYPTITLDDLDLKGEYQKFNLPTVLCALNILVQNFELKDVTDGLKKVAKSTGLRGRWEYLRENVNGKSDILCDTGHNANGLEWVFDQLENHCSKYRNIYIIFGIVADKDADAIAGFMPAPSDRIHYIFTNAGSERALPAEQLAQKLSQYGISGLLTHSVQEALDKAEELSSQDDLIFVGGSNFTVAEVLAVKF